MKIFAALTSGRTFAVEVFPANDTIRDVKALIEGQAGLTSDQQRILFEGKELDNNRTLHHYNIREEKTLTLVLDRKRKQEDISDSEDSC